MNIEKKFIGGGRGRDVPTFQYNNVFGYLCNTLNYRMMVWVFYFFYFYFYEKQKFYFFKSINLEQFSSYKVQTIIITKVFRTHIDKCSEIFKNVFSYNSGFERILKKRIYKKNISN